MEARRSPGVRFDRGEHSDVGEAPAVLRARIRQSNVGRFVDFGDILVLHDSHLNWQSAGVRAVDSSAGPASVLDVPPKQVSRQAGSVRGGVYRVRTLSAGLVFSKLAISSSSSLRSTDDDDDKGGENKSLKERARFSLVTSSSVRRARSLYIGPAKAFCTN